MTDPFVGRLTFFRVYSGKISTGDFVYNSTSDNKSRVGRLMLMHADKREERSSVSTGEIAAVVGLKQVKTGDTLCSTEEPIVLETLSKQKCPTNTPRRSQDDPKKIPNRHQSAPKTIKKQCQNDIKTIPPWIQNATKMMANRFQIKLEILLVTNNQTIK